MIIDNTSGVNETIEEIGSRIKDLRIASCYTQEELAKKANISESSIRRIEQGKSVQFDNILNVLKALGLMSKIDMIIPVQELTPIQVLKGEKKKKTYRKPIKKGNKRWEWGE